MGKVDAVLAWEPNSFTIFKKMGKDCITWPAQGGQDFYWLLMTCEETIEQRFSVLVKMLQALDQAAEFFQKRPTESLAIISEWTKVSLDDLQKLKRYELVLDQGLLLAMEDQARWLIQNRLTDRTQVPDLPELYLSRGALESQPQGRAAGAARPGQGALMKLRTSVKLAVVITVCVFLAYGAALFYMDRTMAHLAREVRNANEFSNKISLLRTLSLDNLIYQTERSKRQWAAVYDEVRQLLVNKEYRDLQLEYGLGDIGDKVKIVGDTFQKLLTMPGPERPDDPEAEIRRELRNRLTTQLLLTTQDLLNRFVKLSEEVNQDLIRTQRLMSGLNILALLSLGLIILSAGVFLQRSVLKPVLKLHAGAEIIGAGNLDYTVGMDSRDELGELSRAFDRMTANLQKVTVSRDELVREVAERRRVEAALQESEERLRLLGDNLPESAVYQYRHEPDGKVRFLHMSAGIEKLNGVRVQEALADAGVLHRQILPEYYARLVAAEAHSAREFTDFDMEVPMRRADGEVRWMWLHSRPRRLPDGRTIWDGVQTDITERRQSEEALRESREDLNRAQAVAHTGSWRLDVRKNELTWSDETHRMFGIPKGTPLTYEIFLGTIHPEDREYVDLEWTRGLAGQTLRHRAPHHRGRRGEMGAGAGRTGIRSGGPAARWIRDGPGHHRAQAGRRGPHPGQGRMGAHV